jgi:hypothetical protein
MRVYLVACLAILILGTGGYFFLDSLQQPTGFAYTTDGARITPDWSWRSVLVSRRATAAKGTMEPPAAPSTLNGECDVRAAYQWIFVDFGDPKGEPRVCSDSQ